MDDLEHTMYPRLALNLWYSSCLSLQNAALMYGLGFYFCNTVHKHCVLGVFHTASQMMDIKISTALLLTQSG